MTAVLVVAGAALVVVVVLGFTVWAIGRAEARHEARVRDEMRSDPPVLGGAPQHLRRRRWT